MVVYKPSTPFISYPLTPPPPLQEGQATALEFFATNMQPDSDALLRRLAACTRLRDLHVPFCRDWAFLAEEPGLVLPAVTSLTTTPHHWLHRFLAQSRVPALRRLELLPEPDEGDGEQGGLLEGCGGMFVERRGGMCSHCWLLCGCPVCCLHSASRHLQVLMGQACWAVGSRLPAHLYDARHTSHVCTAPSSTPRTCAQHLAAHLARVHST
jgi:hypothetical protein